MHNINNDVILFMVYWFLFNARLPGLLYRKYNYNIAHKSIRNLC